MRRIFFALTFVSCSIGPIMAQVNEVAKTYGNQLTASDLKGYLEIVASDALEGRRTGTRGQKMAAAFIAEHFEEIGLIPPVNGTYYQNLELYTSNISDAYVKVGDTRYDNFKDVYYSGSASTGGEAQVDVVFAGRGTEEDLKAVDVKDKGVLIISKTLGASFGAAKTISQSVRDKGAKIVYIVAEVTADEFTKYIEARRNRSSSGGRLSLKKPESTSTDKGSFMISQEVAEKMFRTTFEKLKSASDNSDKKALKKLKPVRVSYGVTLQINTTKTENVLGFLEGSDKKEEVVVLTAHYDHIGVQATGEDKINNGADDDGSGTVSVMEMAKLFAKAKKEGHGPRRSMLFMLVTAEEEGLLGSQYYVEHPVYPLANTVVNLNIDMIGRTDPGHKEKPAYVYVIGSDRLSSELHRLSESTNTAYTQLAFDYLYNDENHPTNLYKRSDHWNFAKNGIPIIFYFDGIHEDYHKPSDQVDKIEFPLMTTRAQCVFYTAWEIANRENRITPDKVAGK